jgi:hypothetical protein
MLKAIGVDSRSSNSHLSVIAGSLTTMADSHKGSAHNLRELIKLLKAILILGISALGLVIIVLVFTILFREMRPGQYAKYKGYEIGYETEHSKPPPVPTR